MSAIKLRDKEFAIFISSDDIQSRIAQLAEEINNNWEGKKPLFMGVLNGAFLFSADLFKRIKIECELSFIKVASYEGGTSTTGKIRNIIGFGEEIKGRNIIILEDIVDTGDTATYLLGEIKKFDPASVQIASLLLKPKSLKHKIKVDYVGFEIPNDFIVGYGLDYEGIGRNLNNIYKLVEMK